MAALSEEVADGAAAAAETAKREGVELPLTPDAPAEVGLAGARAVWAAATQQRGLYEQLAASYENRERALDDLEAEVSGRERAAEATAAQQQELRAELEAKDGELSQREAQLAAAEQELQQRDLAVREREADANDGFREKELALYGKVAIDREALHAQADRDRADLRNKADEQRAKLNKAQEELDAALLAAAAKQHELATEGALLEAERKALDERVAREVRARLDRMQLRVDEAERRNQAFLDEIQGKDEQLQSWEALDRQFGSMGLEPGPLRDRLQALDQENRRLQEKLRALPSQEMADRLQELEEQRRGWAEERADLVRQKSELLAEVNSAGAAVTEAESLRDHRDTLLASISSYKEQVTSLRQQIDGMLETARSAEVFPALSQLDKDPEATGRPPQPDPVPPLPELVAYVRDYLASGKPPMYFTDRDLRCFLGGMAMSRLTLLEGISGIGKTSLPRRFAEALGAGEWKIEVQAGWRERQDLLGSYNTFERRYQETEFLRALYLARCPRFQGRPFFIVLDEMNLSHPEYYFADVLSKLEDGEKADPLELMPMLVENAPDQLRTSNDRGTGINLPRNVWFFGTANQDETTVSFADKVYDRAQVIELPSVPKPPAKISERPEQRYFTVGKLREAFDAARDEHAGSAEDIVNALWGPIGQEVTEKLHIGWGARLKEQIRNFAPVVIAAGGDVGEAADHVLARRILRKINDRDDLSPLTLENLRDEILMKWEECGLGSDEPEATKSLLEARIERSL